MRHISYNVISYKYNVCENYVGSVYIGGYGGLSERVLIHVFIMNKIAIFHVKNSLSFLNYIHLYFFPSRL